MNFSPFPTLAALAICTALTPFTAFAQGQLQSPETKVSRLESVVSLTAAQKSQATAIFTKEANALNAIAPADRLTQGADARQGAMDEVRAMLTPEQRRKYNLTPQGQGGGMTQMSPENEVARLDAFARLSADQKAAAQKLFEEQIVGLLEIPSADRALKGMPIRQGTRAQIRALLTPEQLAAYDVTPQAKGGGQNVSPVNLADRLDKTVVLTDEQIPKVAAIYMKMAEALQPLAQNPAEQATKGRDIRQTAQAQIRALLTPDQLQKFDANPNGAEDLEERAYVANFIRTSNAIATRLGAVTRSTPTNSTLEIREVNAKTQSMKGNYGYNVVGSSKSETLSVSWERTSPDAPIKIVKITTSSGETLDP